MSAPATEVLREVERELVIAAESGETRSVNELRTQFELDRDGVLEALSTLREHGKAVEEAPGDWRGLTAGEMPSAEPPRVRVTVQDAGEDEPVEEPDGVREAARMAQAARVQHFTAGAPVFVPPQPQVRLTRAIADALDDQALGKIVKAALDSLEEDAETFRLEVTP